MNWGSTIYLICPRGVQVSTSNGVQTEGALFRVARSGQRTCYAAHERTQVNDIKKNTPAQVPINSEGWNAVEDGFSEIPPLPPLSTPSPSAASIERPTVRGVSI